MSQLPEHIGGYQHIETGPIIEGDIWVLDGTPYCFANPFYLDTVKQAEAKYPRYHIYRKMAVPSSRDDKGLWGEIGATIDAKAATLSPNLAALFYISQDDQKRKDAPMFRGLLGYFPAALFEVAAHSQSSDKKHNPNSKDGPTWARKKSSDHADCIIRHMIDAGKGETAEEIYHLTAIAWRSLAMLQEALEKRGAKPGVSSRQ